MDAYRKTETPGKFMSEWISVKDRLPMLNEYVLVYAKRGVQGGMQIDIEYLCGDMRWSGDSVFSEITHWIPLPKPPRENERVDFC